MSQTFNCPNCGAPLDFQGSDPIIRCPYCSSSVIVPDNLRAKPQFSAQPSNFTLSGIGDMGGLINQARRLKEVKDLAEAGNTERAIAIYREVTGADDYAARQAVERLSSGQPITLNNLTAANVFSAVGALNTVQSSLPPINIQPVEDQTGKTIRRAVGCFTFFIVGTVLVSVIVPLLAGLGIFTALFSSFKDLGIPIPPELIPQVNLPGIEIPGVEIPGVSGFATRELSFGGEGTGPGLFGDVRAIGVDPRNGNIYAANYDDGRVQVFDAQGEFITQWIIKKEITDPYFGDLAVGRDGTVYIPVFGRLMRFDSQGKPLGDLELEDDHIDNLDLAADGTLIVIANGEDILWLTPDGKIIQRLDQAVSSVSGDPELHALVAVDGQNNVYVLGSFNNAVFVFDSEGKFTNRFGSDGDQTGQFRAPQAIEIDGFGRILVSDIKGVQVFSNDGRYLDVIKVQYVAYGLALDDQGQLYLTTNQKKVEKYSFAANQ